jgi:hypothetical protein
MPNLGALLPVFIPGFIAAAVTGYLVIRWLLGYLVNHSLAVFAIYCAAWRCSCWPIFPVNQQNLQNHRHPVSVRQGAASIPYPPAPGKS